MSHASLHLTAKNDPGNNESNLMNPFSARMHEKKTKIERLILVTAMDNLETIKFIVITSTQCCTKC
jgi:hypothetical protein